MVNAYGIEKNYTTYTQNKIHCNNKLHKNIPSSQVAQAAVKNYRNWAPTESDEDAKLLCKKRIWTVRRSGCSQVTFWNLGVSWCSPSPSMQQT